MKVKEFLTGFFSIFFIFLLASYWFIPINNGTFKLDREINSSFNLLNESKELQFYENMRFAEDKISYEISDECSIKKQAEMIEAFNYIENLTILSFYESTNPEIEVSCQEKDKLSGKLFIAGEGGPTEIVDLGDFKLIKKGQILLIRDSSCQRPNVAIHELLHVLGFNHSMNEYNLMYEISRCDQEIGEEIPNLINELYSYPAVPDLKIQSANAEIEGRYIRGTLNVTNVGFIESNSSKLVIYADDVDIKEFELDKIKPGYTLTLNFENLFLQKIKAKEISFEITSDYPELSKENNKVKLIKG